MFILTKTIHFGLLNAIGEVSFTADIWSDQRLGSYLAVTVHWIGMESNEPYEIHNSPLEQKIALAAFHKLHGTHTGKRLTGTLLHLLNRADIASKVSF